MTLRLLLLVNLLVYSVGVQDDEASRRALHLAERMAKSIRACPERVITAQFKKQWVKETWGPPAAVKYDVERTTSMLYPFTASVDFALTVKHGKSYKTREAAAADDRLVPLLTGQYRNLYKFTKDDNIQLDSTLVASSPGKWETRPTWSDACWDKRP